MKNCFPGLIKNTFLQFWKINLEKIQKKNGIENILTGKSASGKIRKNIFNVFQMPMGPWDYALKFN
jgi:hypothetical protein